MGSHSERAKMHNTSSYQSIKDSFSLLENLGRRLVDGPFFSFVSLESCTCCSAAIADFSMAVLRAVMLAVTFTIIS